MQEIFKMQEIYREMDAQRKKLQKRMTSFRKDYAKIVALYMEPVYKSWTPKENEEIVFLSMEARLYMFGKIVEVLENDVVFVHSDLVNFTYSIDLNFERLKKNCAFDLALPNNMVVPMSFFETVKEHFKPYKEESK